MPVGADRSVDKEVVGIEELCTVTGTFELLAGDVLGAAFNFGAAFDMECPLR